MSQSEILRILQRRGGGSITITELALEYNAEHFPQNHNFQQQNLVTIKKTMQHDVAKLLRDRIIIKTKTKGLEHRDLSTNRPTITYTLTTYGQKQLQELLITN